MCRHHEAAHAVHTTTHLKEPFLENCLFALGFKPSRGKLILQLRHLQRLGGSCVHLEQCAHSHRVESVVQKRRPLGVRLATRHALLPTRGLVAASADQCARAGDTQQHLALPKPTARRRSSDPKPPVLPVLPHALYGRQEPHGRPKLSVD